MFHENPPEILMMLNQKNVNIIFWLKIFGTRYRENAWNKLNDIVENFCGSNWKIN